MLNKLKLASFLCHFKTNSGKKFCKNRKFLDGYPDFMSFFVTYYFNIWLKSYIFW